MTDRMGPVPAGERLITLDVLRGIALLGVVIANIWLGFSGLMFRFPGVREELVRFSLDAVVYNGIGVFISNKALSTLSFLFGLGFAMQTLRAAERGVAIAPVYRRRMAVLLLFGLVHGVFFWYWDILAVYALLGLLLLAFRRRSDRTLFVWAAVMIAGVGLALGAVPLLFTLLGRPVPAPDLATMAAENAATLAAFQSTAYVDVLRENLRLLPRMQLSPPGIGWACTSFGLFLLGLYAGRRRFFDDVNAHRQGFRRVASVGLTLGLTCNLGIAVFFVRIPPEVAVANPWLPLLGLGLITFGTVPLAFGYIATATLLLQRPEWQRRLRHFAPVGRMALTTYLTQTLVCHVIFYGYGLGLVGRSGPALGLVIALAIFGAQVLTSRWWLASFHFGPAEWLWRSMTYGAPQPLRIRRTVPAAVPAAPGG